MKRSSRYLRLDPVRNKLYKSNQKKNISKGIQKGTRILGITKPTKSNKNLKGVARVIYAGNRMMQRMIYAGNSIKVRRILKLVGDNKEETRHRVRISIILPEIYFLSLYILFQK